MDSNATNRSVTEYLWNQEPAGFASLGSALGVGAAIGALGTATIGCDTTGCSSSILRGGSASPSQSGWLLVWVGG